ncbi:MAG: sensor histidine kinase [Calothrix sp. CSU_2_0]|nr:sensor histidine kinase [Calothrix sp. CSU_2_0]
MAIELSVQHVQSKSKYSKLIDLESFCLQQLEQLTIQYPICFARIVYYDALAKSHQELINYAPEQANLSQSLISFFRKEEWLNEYYETFSLNRINLDNLELFCYICPFGYKNKKHEYVQLLTRKPLPSKLQKYVIQSVTLLSKYFDIYLEWGQQKAEIQLLEHIIQRATHQLRNSLGLIGLYAKNLCLGLHENSHREQASIISESIQELDTNLTDLIYCGQKDKSRVSLQDLRSVVGESLKGLLPLTHQKKIQILLPDTSTSLLIDRLQIKQVFDNLLSNAVHFSPESGNIQISWQVFHSEVIIKISDQGSGLSHEDAQKVFTPFYSRRPGGTGLGLTIAKKIILDHQGSIWAQNSPEGVVDPFCSFT